MPREERPGEARLKGRHTMQQGFDPPRDFPTAICEIGSWPQTNFLATLELSARRSRSGVPSRSLIRGQSGGLLLRKS